jgi:dienelactone hydrolase
MPVLRSIDFWPEAALLSYETQRVLAMAPAGGADPGEVAWICARVDPANRESWQAEWSNMAREVEEIARNAASTRSARDAYLRACNYWRNANFFNLFSDPRRLEYHRNSQRCFRAAMQWFDAPAEVVEIPYEGTVLDGYLLQPAGEVAKPWPVVIFGGTVDSTAEEKYFAVGRLLTERGIAVLLWDGPGQGASLLERGIPSRHDFEVPIGATIDWIAQRPELDETRIGHIGWGYGGHYALRAAAFEHRLAATVAWNMGYGSGYEENSDEDEYGGLTSVEDLVALADSGKLGNPILARYGFEWDIVRTPGGLDAMREKVKRHDLTGILQQIQHPVLILMGGEDSVSFHGEGAGAMRPAERALSEIGHPDKTLVSFPAEGPGSRHVMADGMERARAVIADWFVERIQPDLLVRPS